MNDRTPDTNENIAETAETTEPRLTLSVKRVRTHVRGGVSLVQLPGSSIVIDPGANLTPRMSNTPISIWTNSGGF